MIYTNQEIEEARNSKGKDRRVYKSRRINNFRELVSYSVEHYAEHIAYKYKNKPSDKEIIKKTYAEAGMDIKAFGTEMLNRGAKKIAVIGKNRYEWCVTYLGTTTSGLIIVPLDKLLPDREIENLIRRSGADTVVCDEKYLSAIKSMKESEGNNLKTIICMDKIDDKDVEYWHDVKENGKKLLDKGDKKYEKVEIDENKMSILLFTSGTTAEAKGVILRIWLHIQKCTTQIQSFQFYHYTILLNVRFLSCMDFIAVFV